MYEQKNDLGHFPLLVSCIINLAQKINVGRIISQLSHKNFLSSHPIFVCLVVHTNLCTKSGARIYFAQKPSSSQFFYKKMDEQLFTTPARTVYFLFI